MIPSIVPILTLMKQNQEKESKTSKKEENNIKNVAQILVMYNDGTYHKVNHGIAMDIKDNETAILDYADCTDEQLKKIMNAFINLGQSKGWL